MSNSVIGCFIFYMCFFSLMGMGMDDTAEYYSAIPAMIAYSTFFVNTFFVSLTAKKYGSFGACLHMILSVVIVFGAIVILCRYIPDEMNSLYRDLGACGSKYMFFIISGVAFFLGCYINDVD